jgi:hypothetical protein
MRRGDADLVVGLLSSDRHFVLIGTDPEEWYVDRDSATRVLREQLEATGGFDIVGGDPHAYGEGDVGWVADQASIRMPDGAEVPMRVTAVARRESGNWRLVQWHASVGMTNEESFGRALPT